MKYALLKSPYQVMIKNKDIPECGENQVCVKVAYCGVCGTDKIMAKNWCSDWTPFGHEISGAIYKVGPNIKDLTAGQKVAVKPGAFCGECPACKKKFFRKCSNLIVAEGGFSEYIIVDKRSVAVAPDSIPLKNLSLAEPLNVAIDILKTAKITKHDSVILFGPGLIGTLAMYIAKNEGANVIAVIGRTRHDYLNRHLKHLNCGFINFTKTNRINSILKQIPNWISQLEQITANLSSRLVVIHTAPPALIKTYINNLPFESCIVNIGLSARKKDTLLNGINMRGLMFKRIQLMSSFSVPSLYFDEAVRYLNSNIINADNFIDNTISLNQLIDNLKTSEKNYMKTTVKNFSETNCP